ncbi:S8 family serine peptidase [Erythrobacter tepidarius]|uniref:S8 family serine peptidase n=1 Tax=Erythrobacter tepidarius TaxID=60454 RepID=UPI000A380A14|nr:S8 family serine peptidase [Erythrobacter tepidarius]
MKRNLIIELDYGARLAEAAFAAASDPQAGLDPAAVPDIAGIALDPSFAPTVIPGVHATDPTAPGYVSGQKVELALTEAGEIDPNQATYIVRATAEEDKVEEILAQKHVVGVFADVEIQPSLICPGSPPMGDDGDVERLLCVPQMRRLRMDGSGVLVAIVDTGINLAHLSARGRPITLDVARSWVPSPGMVPGNAPVGHGTMCAFDAAIAAPQATFLDIQLLRSSASGPTPMSGVLSDAVRAYSHLISVMTAPRRPGEARSLVVNNSWGMFHPSWDFPVGHPGNYSDNPNHPFNRIVAALERVGADILFAAGNCGANCPDGRCQGVTANAIYGANSHPSVLTIAGVDISNTRVGYSSQGPGRLARNKPDLAGYTHFRGSGVYAADGGTSAATPVVAGVVAAVRSRRPFQPGNPAASPAAIRALMRSTATDLGAAGFDFDHGFGVVGGCALVRRFIRVRPIRPIDICRRIPELCRPRPLPIDICRRFPEICRGVRRPDLPLPPPDLPRPGPQFAADDESLGDFGFELGGASLEDLLAAVWEAGYYDGSQVTGGAAASRSPAKGCGCGCS